MMVNIMFLKSLLASSKTKNIRSPYSDTGLCHVSNFFLNILLKTAQLWCPAAKLRCHRLCTIFSWHTLYNTTDRTVHPIL